MPDELAKRDNTSLVAGSAPSYLQTSDLGETTGLEAISSKDMKMPRLAIAQKMHKQVDEDSPEYIDGLKPGMLFNTLTNEIYGKGPVIITPLVAKHHRRLFSSRDTGSKTLCVSDNGIDGGRISKLCAICPKQKFGWDDKEKKTLKPECTEFWSYIVLLHMSDDIFIPISLSLKSMMLDSALEFNTFMRNRRIGGKTAPAFTGIYEINTFLDTATGGPFHNVKFKNADWISERLLSNVKSLFDEFAPKINVVAASHADDDDGAIAGEIIDEEPPF